VGLVFARTDPQARCAGIAAFIIEKDTPGLTARPFKVLRTSALPNVVHWKIAGYRWNSGWDQKERGLNLCLDLLTGLRFPYPACNIGSALRHSRWAIGHAKLRKAFGELLARRQASQ
jgi:alkylation response protein AidB-like acyl-CoA dehydrogenase